VRKTGGRVCFIALPSDRSLLSQTPGSFAARLKEPAVSVASKRTVRTGSFAAGTPQAAWHSPNTLSNYASRRVGTAQLGLFERENGKTMFYPAHAFLRVAVKWCSVVTRRKPPKPSTRPGVIFHDPAASRPHDLDDLYFDPKVQERMADLIAGAAKKR
jgi:hypothetical protein